jgi:hypothetical protein
MTSHTKTPWELDSIPGEIRCGKLRLAHIYCPAGSGDIQQANAAFIVQACNSFEALVEALTLAISTMDASYAQHAYADELEALQIIKQTLAKAQGKESAHE